MRNSLVQQIGCLQHIFFPSCRVAPVDHSQNRGFGTVIKIKSSEIGGWWALNGQFLRSRDFGAKALGDFLRNFALDREQVFQISVVLLCPDVHIAACVDQLRVYMEPGSCLAHAALQHVRHTKRVPDLLCAWLAAILHDARATDDFEIGNFRKLGQEVVLDTISKGGILSVVAKIFERQDSDAFVEWQADRRHFTMPVEWQRYCQGSY